MAGRKQLLRKLADVAAELDVGRMERRPKPGEMLGEYMRRMAELDGKVSKWSTRLVCSCGWISRNGQPEDHHCVTISYSEADPSLVDLFCREKSVPDSPRVHVKPCKECGRYVEFEINGRCNKCNIDYCGACDGKAGEGAVHWCDREQSERRVSLTAEVRVRATSK